MTHRILIHDTLSTYIEHIYFREIFKGIKSLIPIDMHIHKMFLNTFDESHNLYIFMFI